MTTALSTRPVLALATLGAALLALVAGAPAASAHTQLVGVDPQEGSTVEAGQAVTLTFSEDLLEIGAEATVTGPSGVAIGAEIVPSGATAVITLPDLEGGQVTVAWRIVASDGHPIDGSLAYLADAAAIAPSATPSPATSEAPTPAPATSAAPTQEAAQPAADTEDGDANSGTNVAVWIAIGAAIFAATGGGAAAASAKKKQRN